MTRDRYAVRALALGVALALSSPGEAIAGVEGRASAGERERAEAVEARPVRAPASAVDPAREAIRVGDLQWRDRAVGAQDGRPAPERPSPPPRG